MNKRSNALAGIIKGAIISIGALLPGISGGALCVIMGVYKPMMELLSKLPDIAIWFFKRIFGKTKDPAPVDIKWYILFFWPIGVGMVIGMLGLSKLLGVVLEKWETEAIFLFIGLIVGTLPGLLKEARQKGVSKGSWIALAAALGIMLAWMIPMSMGGQASIQPSTFWWCLCGVLWGLGIVVPGMSPSNLFFFLGLAAPMYAAIGDLNFGVILPMGLFLALTIVGLSKGIGYCLENWYSMFMHAVVGVVLASTLVIFPPFKLLITPGYTFATGIGNWLVYIVCMAVGALGAWGLEKWKAD